MNRKSFINTLLAIVIILVIGGGVSLVLLWTGPEIVPEEKGASAKIVQTLPLRGLPHSISVSAYGSVIPARKLVIRPQVSGQVVGQSASMIAGGRVKHGEELIRIDGKDYELALAEVRSNLEQARFEREVESGRQVVAKRDWATLESELDMGEVNRSLVLREPHLRRAEALMEKAQNDIEIAELQLSRTVITAPFNGMVVEESVEVGQLLSQNSAVCELVGTDEFWIQVTLPISKLKWVQFPENGDSGAEVEVILDTGDGESLMWNGRVVRLLSDLDPLGRMARLVVSVEDPLGIAKNADRELPLLLGSYVEVRIDAGELSDAMAIPREALREGNLIWVVGPDGLLRVLSPEVLWSEKDTFYISNIVGPEDELIVSDLRVALPGMEVEAKRSSAYPDYLKQLNEEAVDGS